MRAANMSNALQEVRYRLSKQTDVDKLRLEIVLELYNIFLLPVSKELPATVLDCVVYVFQNGRLSANLVKRLAGTNLAKMLKQPMGSLGDALDSFFHSALSVLDRTAKTVVSMVSHLFVKEQSDLLYDLLLLWVTPMLNEKLGFDDIIKMVLELFLHALRELNVKRPDPRSDPLIAAFTAVGTVGDTNAFYKQLSQLRDDVKQALEEDNALSASLLTVVVDRDCEQIMGALDFFHKRSGNTSDGARALREALQTARAQCKNHTLF